MFPTTGREKVRPVDPDAVYGRRVALGLTVAELAVAAGVGQATIYRLEGGQTKARIGTLRRLAEALHTDLESLLIPSRAAA